MSARILVVDDMLPSVKMLAAKLMAEYYEVLTANDGPSALAAVNEHNPDLVLLDVMMPGMDGYEVCERIKQNPETTHIPVVMVTALSDREERVRGLAAGADDFLTKPVVDTTLFARVRSLVRLKRMLDQWRLREETTRKLGLAEEAQPDPSRGGDARVVLIDESRVESKNIEKALAADGDDVILIDGLDGAVERAAAADGDVIVVALSGEGEPALRLAAQLRSVEATRQTPVLLIGDEGDVERLIKTLELGINDYVLRPLDDQELLARVRTQVRRKRYQDSLQSNFLQSLSLALTDSLTGMHNRRYLETHLEAMLRRMAEDSKPVCFLMLDIDHFKQVNDTHGHPVGDQVLREIARRIGHNIRGFDMASRYGGEEFAVVMPDTDLAVAVAVAERLRERIESNPFTADGVEAPLSLTVSIGVAQNPMGMVDPDALIKAADEALYQAKDAGRNRVIPEPGQGPAQGPAPSHETVVD